jgi:hypothetical protein
VQLVLARKALEPADDFGDAQGQAADVRQVGLHGLQCTALQQHAGVVVEGPQRGQRLVDLVRDAGRHLPRHGQLAGLHQLVLRRAQRALRAVELDDLARQVLVGLAQVGGQEGQAAHHGASQRDRRTGPVPAIQCCSGAQRPAAHSVWSAVKSEAASTTSGCGGTRGR